MSRIRTTNTTPELRVRALLRDIGVSVQRYAGKLPGRPDIVLQRHRTVLFIHGCFWHGHSCAKGRPPATNVQFWTKKITANKVRDRRVNRQLRAAGWRVITIWGCAFRHEGSLIKRLRRLLG
jgi:DNA mismatch endonuclease (patch repair protein)